MLTKKQADTLRGHISHLVTVSRAYGGLAAKECSEEDWKCAVIACKSAGNRLHKFVASVTEPQTEVTKGD